MSTPLLDALDCLLTLHHEEFRPGQFGEYGSDKRTRAETKQLVRDSVSMHERMGELYRAAQDMCEAKTLTLLRGRPAFSKVPASQVLPVADLNHTAPFYFAAATDPEVPESREMHALVFGHMGRPVFVGSLAEGGARVGSLTRCYVCGGSGDGLLEYDYCVRENAQVVLCRGCSAEGENLCCDLPRGDHYDAQNSERKRKARRKRLAGRRKGKDW